MPYKDRDKARLCVRKAIWRIKQEVLLQYSCKEYPVCAHCGETDIKVLQIDHIKGNGKEERKKFKVSAGHNFYKRLKKVGFPEGYQVLCANCNQRKTYDERNLFAGVLI